MSDEPQEVPDSAEQLTRDMPPGPTEPAEVPGLSDLAGVADPTDAVDCCSPVESAGSIPVEQVGPRLMIRWSSSCRSSR